MKIKQKILVVDDEPVNIKLLEANLIPNGYDVITASDGEEALRKVLAEDIDLILLDVMMPKMNGFEVTKKLKTDEKTRLIPVILVTALSGLQDRVKGIDAGCDDFLSKPVERPELLARVKSLLTVKAYHDCMQDYEKKLEYEVAKKTKELQSALDKVNTAHLETIYCLSRAAEYKDEHTGSHIQRMSNYAAVIAENIGLDKQSVKQILYAAPMHDIGKIGIPDHILLKPGKLTPGEWEIMKQHTIIGAEILANSEADFIKLAEVIALTHHEKWDGSGYPKGLKAAGIPAAGRICAIADVFDALTSKRPYKEIFPVEKSFAIIKDGRGNYFDPEMTDAFLTSRDKILEIRNKYKDDGESKLLKMSGKGNP
ncbi:MAG: two-component system response regulator [bacterium]